MLVKKRYEGHREVKQNVLTVDRSQYSPRTADMGILESSNPIVGTC